MDGLGSLTTEVVRLVNTPMHLADTLGSLVDELVRLVDGLGRSDVQSSVW